MPEPLRIVCSGRPVDREGAPYGDPCGKAFDRYVNHGGGLVFAPDNAYATWTPPTRTPEADASYRNAARAAGWSIGPGDEATCPRCRRPDPQTVRDCAAIERSLT